jgi:hypothetical protein
LDLCSPCAFISCAGTTLALPRALTWVLVHHSVVSAFQKVSWQKFCMHSISPHTLMNHNVPTMPSITTAIVRRRKTLVQISAWVPAVLSMYFRYFSQFLQEKNSVQYL